VLFELFVTVGVFSLQKDFLKNLAPDGKASQLCLDNRLYYVGLSRDEATKQLYFTKEAYNREDVSAHNLYLSLFFPTRTVLAGSLVGLSKKVFFWPQKSI